jgi:acetyl-CoA carboxylase beta subunit/acetyl-CoA carboxylase alpha subunit
VKELADHDSFHPISDGLESRDPLGYPDYRGALEAARDKAGTDESVITGPAQIGGREVELAVFSFGFMGGSMGEVAGERIARTFERAAERGVPVVLQISTGGARMQEGMRALVQLPRVVAARMTLGDALQPYIAVLGEPTTGGVLASAGALADVTIAVAGATVGFAGPRVAARFTGDPLDPNSHTAISAFRHGLVDEVISEGDLPSYVSNVLSILAPDERKPLDDPADVSIEKTLSGWEAVVEARHPDRPRGPELAREAAESYSELRGDRAGSQDPAVFAALARIAGRRVLMLALDAELAPGPAGFRLARRAVAIAGRLDIPIVTLVDTRGADPSEDSEAGGIAWEIAALFEAMLDAPVPILSVVTGEGGSGGALAFAVADRLVAYEDSIFSVIAPESAAEILWRDASEGERAANLLRLTARDLLELEIADDLAPAPLGVETLRALLAYHLDGLARDGVSRSDRAGTRRERWRR